MPAAAPSEVQRGAGHAASPPAPQQPTGPLLPLESDLDVESRTRLDAVAEEVFEAKVRRLLEQQTKTILDAIRQCRLLEKAAGCDGTTNEVDAKSLYTSEGGYPSEAVSDFVSANADRNKFEVHGVWHARAHHLGRMNSRRESRVVSSKLRRHAGCWIDPERGFFDGATIVITDESWYPVYASGKKEDTAIYTCGLGYAGQCLLRVDGPEDDGTRTFAVERQGVQLLVWQVQGESLEPLKQWVLDPVTAEFTGDGQLGSVSSYDTRLSNGMLRLSDGFLQTYDIICDKVEAWLQYEEPPGTRCIDKTVRNRWFEYICLIVIAGHAVFMLFAADYEVQHRHIDNSDGNIVYVVSLCFTIWYSIELLLKLLSHRQYFFCGPDVGWNMFDLCLVTFAILDHLPASIGDDVTFLRSLRTLRIARTLRILRMVRFLKELRLLMKCILSSFLSSFWCIAFMVFVMYMFALYYVHSVARYLTERENSGNFGVVEEKVQAAFGSVTRAGFSLLLATTGGEDWGTIYDIISPIGLSERVAFVFYILFFWISMWNIVTAMFVEKAMTHAQPDMDEAVQQAYVRHRQEALEIYQLFAQALKMEGLDRDVRLTAKQFMSLMENADLRYFLRVRGIEIKQSRVFYDMLAQSVPNASIDIDTLTDFCIHVKGIATSIEVNMLVFETKMLFAKQRESMQACEAEVRRLANMMQAANDC